MFINNSGYKSEGPEIRISAGILIERDFQESSDMRKLSRNHSDW